MRRSNNSHWLTPLQRESSQHTNCAKETKTETVKMLIVYRGSWHYLHGAVPSSSSSVKTQTFPLLLENRDIKGNSWRGRLWQHRPAAGRRGVQDSGQWLNLNWAQDWVFMSGCRLHTCRNVLLVQVAKLCADARHLFQGQRYKYLQPCGPEDYKHTQLP